MKVQVVKAMQIDTRIFSYAKGLRLVSKWRQHAVLASTTLFLAPLLFLLAACNSDYTAGKKRGYYRISFPEKQYQRFDQPGYPYTFEYPVYATISKDSTFFQDPADDFWINIDFPRFAGRIYISYKPVVSRSGFDSLVQDGFKLAYRQHVNMATQIVDSVMRTPSGAEGIYFSLGGNTATANQFFVTDSVRHFLRGALYFDATPNADSLGIVNEFLKKDLQHLINTLQWRNATR
jgi:gliding motility-associated lipoprotein GldD